MQIFIFLLRISMCCLVLFVYNVFIIHTILWVFFFIAYSSFLLSLLVPFGSLQYFPHRIVGLSFSPPCRGSFFFTLTAASSSSSPAPSSHLLPFSSLHCSRFTSVYFTSVYFTSVHFTFVHFSSLHYSSLYFSALHFSSLQFTSLQFT